MKLCQYEMRNQSPYFHVVSVVFRLFIVITITSSSNEWIQSYLPSNIVERGWMVSGSKSYLQ